jgi:small-conductance mechanosensitive channel
VFDNALGLLSDLIPSKQWSAPFVVGAVAVFAFVATRISRFVVRRVIRHLATASAVANGAGLWRVRSGRVGGEPLDVREQRRRQRVDAASRMVNHLVSVGIWLVALIVTFHLLDIDPAFFLSSAGFLGAALAIGGQHNVNDYLTGLSVHFEDRYGVGDRLTADVGWDHPVTGVVDHIGLFSTRIRDERSALHFPNSSLANVRNLSQEAAVSTIKIQVPPDVRADDAATVLRGLAGTDGLTDVVFVGDLSATESHTGEIDVEVRTSRTLDARSRARLIHRTERGLGR